MSWYSSWLPGLPTFNLAIPSSIQGRFLSFILRKSLGHLVKPGKLDHHQIDSQIGSGYVQVNDLELNPEAINAYLDGLPVALESGTISSIKARIPWPNPLASTLGFSLKSLHLVFQVIPFIKHPHSGNVDLTESVASVAENFIHQELSPGEEATIWKSFHQDSEIPPVHLNKHPIPGSLDDSSSSVKTSHPLDSDPAGVSLFSSLIERLMARFEFDVEDIKITIVHPGNTSLTLSLDEIQYHTTGKVTTEVESSGPVDGASRTLSVTGLLVSSRNLASEKVSAFLRNTTESPGTHTPGAPLSRPRSLDSSESSLDENTQFMMSQSLAALPPRPPSSVGSVSSSMYESAISEISPLQQSTLHQPVDHFESSSPSSQPINSPSSQPVHNDTSPDDDAGRSDEIFLSFGSQPISIQLKTPSPITKTADDDVDPFLPTGHSSTSRDDQLQVSVSIGIVSCAIRPWQMQAILRLSQVLVPDIPQQTDSSPKDTQGANLPPLRISGQIRGIVVLLVPSSPNAASIVATLAAIRKFFERPLVPPVLEHGCTRLYLDTFIASIEISNGRPPEDSPGTKTSHETEVKSMDFSISDFSVFLFCKNSGGSGENGAPNILAFPLLLTDPNLISQYPRLHIHPRSNQAYPDLSVFDVINWTDERTRTFGTKLSQWRCQPPRSSRSKSYFAPQGLSTQSKEAFSSSPPSPFLSLNNRTIAHKDGVTDILDIHVSPLNIRVDLDHLLQPGGPLSFFEDLLPSVRDAEIDTLSDDTVEDLYASTWNIAGNGRAPEGPGFTIPQPPSKLKAMSSARHSSLTVKFSMIRLAIRSPPPRLQDRSGTFIIDLHDIDIAIGSKPTKPGARFSGDNTPASRQVEFSDESMLLKLEFSRVVAACSMVGDNTASTFASIGALTDEEADVQVFSQSEKPAALQPRIFVIRPSSNQSRTAPSLALSVDIPAVHVDITKPEFDALQYWADDISQLIERLSGSSNQAANLDSGDSRDGSLIGSRFFAKSRSGSGSTLTTGTTDSAESVVKLTITEAFVRIMVPRNDSDKTEPRPIELKASDVDILLELNPDNRQQTILTLGIINLVVNNTDRQGHLQQFLSLTSPRSLSASPKSIVKLRFSTTTTPNLNTKETRIKLTLDGFTYCFFPDIQWISDLTLFAKNPPGTFESVIPSDRTRISVKVTDGSIRLLAPQYPGSVVFHLGELEFSTDVVDDSRGSSFNISAASLAILVIDNVQDQLKLEDHSSQGVSIWVATGYALVAEIADLDVELLNQIPIHPSWKVLISRIVLSLHLCGDTLSAVTAFIPDFSSSFKSPDQTPVVTTKGPTVVSQKERQEGRTLMSSVEDLAFKKVPAVGSAPDMIYDDLPTNLDYLDESFGAAAGLRELRDDDLDEFEDEQMDRITKSDDPSVVSRIGGETIKIFESLGLQVVEDYFLTIPPEKSSGSTYDGDLAFSLKILDANFSLFLYDGYDWVRTRRTIEEEVKEMRKRLAKIRQLVANGQMQDPTVEDTSAWLYNSVHIGLTGDEDLLAEPSALIAAIDEELKDDLETASQSSWQSLKPTNSSKPRVRSTRVHGKRLTRSKGPSMEFSLAGLQAEFDQYNPNDPLVSRTFVTVRDLEILDHIKTSTWKKFLTELRSDSRGNVRETDSNMVRIELRNVRPVPGHSSEEVRLRAKILPLRLYVDQDAVDFLKKFFGFKDPHAPVAESSSEDNEAYIQLAEIFPIDLKLDYKPRRVDYRALKEGRTIELMNFFHFDGAEMTLRHITLSGVTGWPRLFEMLNDLWTPDVKATQLVEVISGVAPIRSVVNVGSGVADLILLPIAQYKKDGRIVRGMQKGATAFVKSTAIEAIKMGAKLATGTQVILEQAEGVLGGQFEDVMTAEPLQVPSGEDYNFENEEEDINHDLISKYAQQPTDLREGVQSAYKSLQRNLNSAAQTILAVPMEVYERSGNEGPVRSVIRAVPIAVLKPMIGASEAISKTLLGLHNTLDPNVRHDTEAKYKLR